MWDWNNNGKYDCQDSFIDYHIYKSVTGNKGNPTSDSGGCLNVISVGLLILGILLIFV